MLFLYNRTNIWIRRQAFTSLQHGFLGSEENVVLHNFETPKSVWENVVTNNIFIFIFVKSFLGRCYAFLYYKQMFYLADVITKIKNKLN